MKLEFSLYGSDPLTPARLDAYLAQTLAESRTLIKQAFKNKHIVIQHPHSAQFRVPSASDAPKSRMHLVIDPYQPRAERHLQPNLDLPVPILYEDDHLWVVNKPRGYAVNALTYTETNTLANFFLAKAPNLWSWEDRPLEPGVVHRLDQWTSGCLIGVKTPEALQDIRNQFKLRRVIKIYLVMVEGKINWEDTWEDELIHDPKNYRKMTVVSSRHSETQRAKARKAILSFRPIRQFQDKTLVEIHLKTGRMHQIRAQFSQRGFPVWGDRLYKAKQPAPFDGYWLHAQFLSVVHPRTKQRMFFSAPIPDILKNSTKTLSGQ